MATLGHVILFSLLGGIISLIGGALLISKEHLAKKMALYATPFAAGALLAAVFIDLLPEGVADGEASTVMLAALLGFLTFFLAESFLRWFHHHPHTEDHGGDPNRSLVVIGDAVHNALDGVVIAAAFLVSVPTGIVATFAVAAHEIPQEIGDFGLLLSKGMSRKKVLLVNILTAITTVVFAVLTFQLGSADLLPIGMLLGLSAGFLLYIATSDIIPTIHERSHGKSLFNGQVLMLMMGVLIVGAVINVAHDYIDTGHGHGTESSEYADDHGDEDKAHSEEDEHEENDGHAD
jgi:zinc and cadmium transporter